MDRRRLCALLASLALVACDSVERPPPPDNDGIYAFAQGCYALDATDPGSTDTRWLEVGEEETSFRFSARTADEGSRFFLKPSDLGTYLFYDADGQYLIAEEGELRRTDTLDSDVLLLDDAFISPAEWELSVSAHDPDRFQLRNRASGEYLTRQGTTPEESDAGVIALYPTEGCAEFPELTLDADGVVEPRTFGDGSVYGFVETHSHVFSNMGFGGGGIFHGAPYHRLGVEHALPDCTPFHGPEGRRDIFGAGFDDLNADFDADTFVSALVSGRLPEFNHHTEGYPTFTDWPAAPFSSTHQTQYYRWIERAWMGGLRLMIQHATTNAVICDLMVGQNIQPTRYSCNDMVAVDRIIEETYALERYIDAQWGGPGLGWFRVVQTPADARRVIEEGNLAVVLGIETSNLFDCFLTPPPGMERCTEADVLAQLDRYHELGVRVMFPVHKYDNGFSAGDGDRSFIELGNWINSGHWSSFTEDCSTEYPGDGGDVFFGGINMPRAVYDSMAPNDFSGFANSPIGTVGPFLDEILMGRLEGDYCQSHGLTALGEFLLTEMMRRGMIIEFDHFNRRAYERAWQMVQDAAYPGIAGTHGRNFGGRVFELGGVSKAGLGRCADPANPAAMLGGLGRDWATIEAQGGYVAEGFGFDLNGFAGAPGPRFGERSRCSEAQENPVEYPFTSYAGDVTFTEPRVGERVLDFNTEGMSHLGLVPELIEDARRNGVTDEELEPLFRSAEAYLRMWEAAEARAAEL